MNKRIALWLLATFFLTTVFLAEAQQAGKILRIGYLDSGTAAGSAVLDGDCSGGALGRQRHWRPLGHDHVNLVMASGG
jgi:hypothetical protein